MITFTGRKPDSSLLSDKPDIDRDDEDVAPGSCVFRSWNSMRIMKIQSFYGDKPFSCGGYERWRCL